MALTRLRPLAALSLLIALGAIAAPPERVPSEEAPAARPRHPRRMPPQHPPMPPTREHMTPRQMRAAEVQMPSHFHMAQRNAAQAYYDEPEHRGFVPPGLARQGGVPPGQTRLWQRGYPLPAGVVWYALPRSLELVLGPPPAGHRYVRVASDILLIAIGTGIVVDAMEDLAR
jgi:Ni/Co efflux regulator RcnB